MTSGRARARRAAAFLPAVILSALVWAPAFAQEPPRPGEPEIPAATGFVNDHAGALDPTQRAQLEAFLEQVRSKTGVQFAVLAVRSTAPITPSEYKVMVFERWGIGRRGEDDGLLLLVALEEREARFETGYGLEGTLPDVLQTSIFREQMAPRFRAGDYAGGIQAGVLAAAERIAREKGVTLEWDGRELRYGDGSASRRRLPVWAVVLIFFGLVVLFSALAARGAFRPNRRRRYWGGGWGGGWGGWGGGFGGGGGSFGGGSFGGFGGGASGGGGGGGKW